MTRRRGIAFGIAGLFIIAGAGGYLISRSTRTVSDGQEFHRASWMPAESSRMFERLMNDIVDRKSWNEEEAHFLLMLMRLPRTDLPPGFDDVIVPRADDSPDVIEAFLQRPGAEDALRWNFETFSREIAWAEVQDRLVAGKEMPPALRTEALAGWTDMLDDPDMYTRTQGATALVATGLFRGNPDLEMTIESMRLGDPSADVRAAIDRRIQHYDRTHHGVEPDGPTSECNTCP